MTCTSLDEPKGSVHRPDADRSLRVRCQEFAPLVGDLEHNCRVITAHIHDAMAAKAQLLVLPELATSGYHLTAAEGRACGLKPDAGVFLRWAGMLSDDAVLVVGFCEPDGERLYNSAAVLDRSGVRQTYRKTHLWDTEKSVFTPGSDRPPVLDTPAGRLGVLICYDLEFPEMPRQLALAGAEVVAVPTNWPLGKQPDGEHPAEVVQAMAAARASGIVIAALLRPVRRRTRHRLDPGNQYCGHRRLAPRNQESAGPIGRHRRPGRRPPHRQPPKPRPRRPQTRTVRLTPTEEVGRSVVPV